MGDKTAIEWTDATWNPVAGCSKVSEGCRNCYAMRSANRMRNTGAYEGLTQIVPRKGPQWTGKVRVLPKRLSQPLRWRRPRRIFVNSMSDLFHEEVPVEYIDQVFAVMAMTRRHTYQVLTKRPENMACYFTEPVGGMMARQRIGLEILGLMLELPHFQRAADPVTSINEGDLRDWPIPNVWLGTSVENQAAADSRIPQLLRAPAAVRWLSCEPLLGPVDVWSVVRKTEQSGLLDFVEWDRYNPFHLHWIVVGGESGPGARPMHPDWTRSLRQQATEAGVAFHFKQWGAWAPVAGVYEEHEEDGVVDEDHVQSRLDEVRDRAVIALEASGAVPQRLHPNEFCHYQPNGSAWWIARTGKKAAGRVLDGRTWDEYPGGDS